MIIDHKSLMECNVCYSAKGEKLVINKRPLITANENRNYKNILGVFPLNVEPKPEIDELIATTNSIRCMQIKPHINFDEAVSACGVYTRILSFAFSHFIVSQSGWKQIGLQPDDFEEGKTIKTNVGVVHCIFDPSYWENPKEIKRICEELIEIPSNRTPRTKIIQ